MFFKKHRKDLQEIRYHASLFIKSVEGCINYLKNQRGITDQKIVNMPVGEKFEHFTLYFYTNIVQPNREDYGFYAKITRVAPLTHNNYTDLVANILYPSILQFYAQHTDQDASVVTEGINKAIRSALGNSDLVTDKSMVIMAAAALAKSKISSLDEYKQIVKESQFC